MSAQDERPDDGREPPGACADSAGGDVFPDWDDRFSAPGLAPPGAEPSGVAWVSRFQTSTSLDDLAPGFRPSCSRFVAALCDAGALVVVNATLRPIERAYLMHYAFRIASGAVAPTAVPRMRGVDIDWVHPTPAASRRAASEMVAAYGIAYAPALVSRHTVGCAVDMTIGWEGELRLALPDGRAARIASVPTSGANPELHRVGAAHGVIKLVADPPHWSDNGH